MRTLSWLSLLVMAMFLSCDKSPEDKSDQEGQIYFRWEQSLTFPPCGGCGAWCDMISGNFRDDNPAVPDNAIEGNFYGPSQPGTFNASFNFDRSNPGGSVVNFSYTLQKPANGYARYYTQRIREYSSSLNRCVAVASSNYLTYNDQPL